MQGHGQKRTDPLRKQRFAQGVRVIKGLGIGNVDMPALRKCGMPRFKQAKPQRLQRATVPGAFVTGAS